MTRDFGEHAAMEQQVRILEVKDLSKDYKSKEGKVRALKALNLQVTEGEIFGLLGPNGAGKTTAVKLMMGFMRPTSGEIFFKNRPLRPAEPRPLIGYLPESFQPNPNLTVYEYIRFHHDLTSDHVKSISKSDIKRLLELVGMDRFFKRKISALSKGMGQRVAFAQALVNDPDFLIMDEPTSGLDPVGRSEIIEFLMEMKKNGKTIFFCSHILSEVERLCDRIGILVDGQLRYIGIVEGFLKKWKTEYLEKAFKMEAQCELS